MAIASTEIASLLSIFLDTKIDTGGFSFYLPKRKTKKGVHCTLINNHSDCTSKLQASYQMLYAKCQVPSAKCQVASNK